MPGIEHQATTMLNNVLNQAASAAAATPDIVALQPLLLLFVLQS
jgi:hypothetical protein